MRLNRRLFAAALGRMVTNDGSATNFKRNKVDCIASKSLAGAPNASRPPLPRFLPTSTALVAGCGDDTSSPLFLEPYCSKREIEGPRLAKPGQGRKCSNGCLVSRWTPRDRCPCTVTGADGRNAGRQKQRQHRKRAHERFSTRVLYVGALLCEDIRRCPDGEGGSASCKRDFIKCASPLLGSM